jgi:hypothetical protein
MPQNYFVVFHLAITDLVFSVSLYYLLSYYSYDHAFYSWTSAFGTRMDRMYSSSNMEKSAFRTRFVTNCKLRM